MVVRFICSQHPKRKGKSLNARLRTKSIGVSPSRLHCGRTASYGSIIIPCTCLCHLQEQPGFLLYKTLSLASPGRSWRFYNLGLGLPDTSNVSNECVFSCHGVEVLPLTYSHWERPNYRVFLKNILKNFDKNKKNH